MIFKIKPFNSSWRRSLSYRGLRHEWVKTRFLFCASEWRYSASITPVKSNPLQMLFKMGVLKNFGNFTGKHPCWTLFLIKLQAFSLAILLKRDPNTDIFLWNSRKVYKHLFVTQHLQWMFLSCIVWIIEIRWFAGVALLILTFDCFGHSM